MIQTTYNNPTVFTLKYQPADWYAQQINKQTSISMNDIHKIYYPDLADDEFGLDKVSQNELLYSRNKLQQLAKYGTYTSHEITYNNIKNNSDFKELISSKYLNGADKFVNFLSDMASLEAQRTEKIAVPYIPYANISYTRPIAYEKYNMSDYLKMLNDLSKTPHISDDLKYYFLTMKADKIDIYYTRLDKLSSTSDTVKTLTQRLTYSKE